MTLLLTFFIVLAAMSEPKRVQFEQVASSMSKAMGKEKEQAGLSLQALHSQIAKMIDDSGLEGTVDVETRNVGIAVRLASAMLYQPGEVRLQPEAYGFLRQIAEQAKVVQYPIMIEGHTDDLPISNERIASNWELSSLRASEVVRFLIEHGVPADRLVASGFAHTRPILPPGFPGARERNRRVEIVFLGRSL